MKSSTTQAGYVAILSILIIGAVSLAIASALLIGGADSQREILALQQSTQARNLATSCGEEAMQQIHDNTTFTGTNSLSLGAGNCTYTVTNPGGTSRTILATGIVGDATRSVQISATVGVSAISVVSWQDTTANASGAVGTPTFVQVQSSTPQGSVASVASAYTAQTAGNLNVIIIGWNNITSNISSVTDSAGNTYQIAAPTTRGNTLSQAIYYAKNIKAGANTVTVNFDASTDFPDLRILEYSGIDQTSPFDVAASASGNITPASSGNLTTNVAKTLIVGGGTTQGAFSAAGSGFTLRTITAQDGDIAEDMTLNSVGTAAATGPVTGAWVMQAAAFKASGQ